MSLTRSLIALVPAALVLAAPLTAHANLELAKKNACMACHAVDKKLVGPAYLEVARKYEGKKGRGRGRDGQHQGGRFGQVGADSDARAGRVERCRRQDPGELDSGRGQVRCGRPRSVGAWADCCWPGPA